MGDKQACPKVRHSSREQAENAMHKTWRKSWQSGTGRKLPTRVYECPNCLGYHLTSSELVPPAT